MKLPVATMLFSFLFAPSAYAYCSQPSFYSSPPTPPGSYERPDVPYCLSAYAYTQKHTCDQWELDSYFDDVDDYVEKLKTFYNEVADYANSAKRYSDDSYDFAKCEIDEVIAQHE
ncbi:MAG: hypothetical protein ABIQ30_16340 [Devosia sp.]